MSPFVGQAEPPPFDGMTMVNQDGRTRRNILACCLCQKPTIAPIFPPEGTRKRL